MTNVKVYIVSLLIFSTQVSLALDALVTASKVPQTKTCLSSREFITTLQYLRSKKEFGLSEQQAQKKAHSVSTGCTGAAQRFISSVETLVKVEAGSTFAVDIGAKLAHKSDAYTKTFLGVFKNAYLKSNLNLDLHTSLTIAQSLSIDYMGDVTLALSDFLKIAQFCQSEKIQLAGPQCGVIAHQVILNNQHTNKSVAESFQKVFEFVQTTKSLSAPIITALEISRDIVKTHPVAAENFIQAYRYGISKSGLDLPAKASLDFAQVLAKRSWVDPKLAHDLPLRLPASQKNK